MSEKSASKNLENSTQESDRQDFRLRWNDRILMNGCEVRPSMEACGIDVYERPGDNGFHIQAERTRDEGRTILSLILVE